MYVSGMYSVDSGRNILTKRTTYGRIGGVDVDLSIFCLVIDIFIFPCRLPPDLDIMQVCRRKEPQETEVENAYPRSSHQALSPLQRGTATLHQSKNKDDPQEVTVPTK